MRFVCPHCGASAPFGGLCLHPSQEGFALPEPLIPEPELVRIWCVYCGPPKEAGHEDCHLRETGMVP